MAKKRRRKYSRGSGEEVRREMHRYKRGRAKSGPHAGDVAAVLFQVIRDLQFIELGRHPEIGEEQNHQAEQSQIDRRARIQCPRDVRR